MNTNELKRFAQVARRQLIEQVGARLQIVLHTDSAELREKEQAVKDLKEQITKTSEATVTEKVAYTWFNRFCALRFMDVNRYTTVGTVSPAEGFSQPEILQEAKQGYTDENLKVNQQKINDLLSDKTPASDPQQEAYRLLLVSVCNSYHAIMPFMFERIADYTELLIPEDLLSENSILHAVRDALHEENCHDVEVIGWLYQFYISEKKDQVFEGLKKNKKITPENIPAATQLFTPHWIVRYLVENSLGRLWMLNRPQSGLITKMDYYIKPEEQETDFLKIVSPEEIKICDPACGSGHMLTYTFDLLYAIYEEEGYDLKDIPALILTKNLYGIEIDERAGALAAFALTMKARDSYRRFFRKPVQPNICVLKNIVFDNGEIKNYMDAVGRDLFTIHFQNTLHQFQEADNFGSLIRPDETNVDQIYDRLNTQGISSNMFLMNTHKKVLKVLHQADYLSPKYHVVIANPPYMGGKGMNGRMGTWLKENYKDAKSDLFSAFIVRNSELTLPNGQLGFMTPFVWMFISSYEKLRNFLITQKTITSLVQLEYSGFDGATVPICTFTVQNNHNYDFNGGYVRLSDFRGSENQAPRTLEAIQNNDCGWFFRASASDFQKIPGSPIAYWASEQVINIFDRGEKIGDIVPIKSGMSTTDNTRFLRFWAEISFHKFGLNYSSLEEAEDSLKTWFPYKKGGGYRKWAGNDEYCLNWGNDGFEIKAAVVNNPKDPNTTHWSRRIFGVKYFFKPGITWTRISSGNFSCRIHNSGYLFSDASNGVFPNENLYVFLALLNSKVYRNFLSFLAPTLNFMAGDVSRLPYLEIPQNIEKNISIIVREIIRISQLDWDAYEISWAFSKSSLFQQEIKQNCVKDSYRNLRNRWHKMIETTSNYEDQINQILIEVYGLKTEQSPEVPINEITLICNPHHRYNSDKNEEELEKLLLTDTMKEFISYAVGCMLGRYSLDKPGLVLANQGETVADYLQQIPKPSFHPDQDNVIPILDGEWFVDDIAARFRKFLKVTFGEEHFEENLKFIEDAIGKDIRKFFLKDFYTDHVKRYKKRPIYWLFSSPKGSFNALIYMHRYRPDTVSIILNDYLREFRTKLISRREHLEAISISATANKTEKTKALKEIEKIKKTVAELEDYERDTLYPLATQKIDIDLDDGVKVNYKKFGKALKKVTGLS